MGGFRLEAPKASQSVGSEQGRLKLKNPKALGMPRFQGRRTLTHRPTLIPFIALIGVGLWNQGQQLADGEIGQSPPLARLPEIRKKDMARAGSKQQSGRSSPLRSRTEMTKVRFACGARLTGRPQFVRRGPIHAIQTNLTRFGARFECMNALSNWPRNRLLLACHPAILSDPCRSLNTFAANAGTSSWMLIVRWAMSTSPIAVSSRWSRFMRTAGSSRWQRSVGRVARVGVTFL
jgi:hypothetical protein